MDEAESPESSLPHVLKTRSRNKHTGVDDGSNISLASTETSGGLRASFERGMDRLSTRGSTDEGRRHSTVDIGKKISDLIHRKKKITKKKKKSEKEDESVEGADVLHHNNLQRGRSRSHATQSGSLLEPVASATTRHSTETDADAHAHAYRSASASRDSSLLTDDSDVEG